MSSLENFSEYIKKSVNESPNRRETIRDFFGKIIAYIDYKENGDQELRNYQQTVLGRYIVSKNTTTDYFGKILSRGNTLVGLIKQ